METIQNICGLGVDAQVCVPTTAVDELIYRDLLIARSTKWIGVEKFGHRGSVVRGEISSVKFTNCIKGVFYCQVGVRLIGEVWSFKLDPDPFTCHACVALHGDGTIDCYYWADPQELFNLKQANSMDYRPCLTIPPEYYE